jgi:hypothetical protein
MKKRLVMAMVLLAIVSLVTGAQVVAPQFDVAPRVPVVRELASFVCWFPSAGYSVRWSVDTVFVGTGEVFRYVFPEVKNYLVSMEVLQGSQLVYAESQEIRTQNAPPGYVPDPPPDGSPHDPSPPGYVPPDTSVDLEGLSKSTIGLFLGIIGAFLLLLEQ